MELNKSLMIAAQQHQEEVVARLKDSAEFRGDLNSSFGSDMHSVSFQEISSILRAKPDINIFYRTPCSGSSRFSRRSSTVCAVTDYFSKLMPDSLLLRIFLYLNKRDLFSILLVCRRFGQIGKDQSLWEFMNLENKQIDEETIHSLLDRHMKVLRLASAVISGLSLFTWYDLQNMLMAYLTHLDLSQAKFSTPSTLHRLLSRCRSLQALSLESCELLNDDCCREISKNPNMKYLDLMYARQLSTVGIEGILCNCRKLVELNLSWAEVESDAFEIICQFASPYLRRLNISGFRDLTSVNDENIARLCATCPNLEELDLSDNVLLTEHSLEHICSNLKHLKKLTLSRCYGVEPMALVGMGHLEVLNIYGCITTEGVELLKNRLDPTIINESPYSTVAKPTVGDSVTSIWQRRTRDLY